MKRSASLRHVGYLHIGLGGVSAAVEADPIYPAMFAIMAMVAIVGSEILKELGR